MPVFTPIPHDEFVDQVRILAAELAKSEWTPSFIIGIGRGGEVVEQHGQKSPLDRCPARKTLSEGLNVLQGPARFREAERGHRPHPSMGARSGAVFGHLRSVLYASDNRPMIPDN